MVSKPYIRNSTDIRYNEALFSIKSLQSNTAFEKLKLEMSTSKPTRTQFVFLKVKTENSAVTLCGPYDGVLDHIEGIDFENYSCASSSTSQVGNSMEITLKGSSLTLMKASLLEEVLKLGFKLSSDVENDSLTLSRQVTIQPSLFQLDN